MANGDVKTVQFTVSLPSTVADLLDWLCSEQELSTNRSQMIVSAIEDKVHRYVLEKRPDLAKKTSIVKKQAFFRELLTAIENEATG